MPFTKRPNNVEYWLTHPVNGVLLAIVGTYLTEPGDYFAHPTTTGREYASAFEAHWEDVEGQQLTPEQVDKQIRRFDKPNQPKQVRNVRVNVAIVGGMTSQTLQKLDEALMATRDWLLHGDTPNSNQGPYNTTTKGSVVTAIGDSAYNRLNPGAAPRSFDLTVQEDDNADPFGADNCLGIVQRTVERFFGSITV